MSEFDLFRKLNDEVNANKQTTNVPPRSLIKEIAIEKVQQTEINDNDHVDTFSASGNPFLRKYKYTTPKIKLNCDSGVPYKIKDIPWRKQ